MAEDIIVTAMQIVGNKHKYQKIAIAFIAFLWVQLTFILLGPAFIFMNPYFKCDKTDGNVLQEDACRKIDEGEHCSIINDFTITGYVGLYCDKQTSRNLIQSALYIGSIGGLIFMNALADTWGRRLGIMISSAICTFAVLCMIIGAYAHSTLLLMFGQFLNGFGGYSLIILSYIYISDICQDKIKQKAIIAMSGIVWGFFQMMFCVLFYFWNQWYNFLILLMFFPLLTITILSSFLLVQTPMFLFHKKKDIPKCIDSLHWIATYNDKQEVMPEIVKMIQSAKQTMDEKDQKPESIVKTLKNPAFLKIILAVAIVEFGVNMYYYGIQYSLQQVGFGFGINVLFTGFIQIIGNTISSILFNNAAFFINYVPRRRGLALFNIALGCLGLIFILPFVRDNLILSAIVLSCCRMVTSMSQAIIPLMQLQSFPSTVQSTGSGTIEALSQLGNFATPFVVTAVTDAHFNPVVAVSIVIFILGIAPLKFVKQTLKKQKKSDDDDNPMLKDSMLSEEQRRQIREQK